MKGRVRKAGEMKGGEMKGGEMNDMMGGEINDGATCWQDDWPERGMAAR